MFEQVELKTYDVVRLVAFAPDSYAVHDLTGNPRVPRAGDIARILIISSNRYTLEGLNAAGDTLWFGEFQAPELAFVHRDGLGVRDPTPDNPLIGPVEAIAGVAVLAAGLFGAWWANVDPAYAIPASALVIFAYSRWRKKRGRNFRGLNGRGDR